MLFLQVLLYTNDDETLDEKGHIKDYTPETLGLDYDGVWFYLSHLKYFSFYLFFGLSSIEVYLPPLS